jgi:hypothetical protein
MDERTPLLGDSFGLELELATPLGRDSFGLYMDGCPGSGWLRMEWNLFTITYDETHDETRS